MKKNILIFCLAIVFVLGGCTSQKNITKTKEKEIKQTKTEESLVEDGEQIDALPVSGTTIEQNINQDNSIDIEQDIVEIDDQMVSDDEFVDDVEEMESIDDNLEILDDSDNNLEGNL